MPDRQPITRPPVRDEPHAPVIYAEDAPTAYHQDGIVGVTLCASLWLPDGTGRVDEYRRAVGHLRMTARCARQLMEQLQGVLLMADKGGSEVRN